VGGLLAACTDFAGPAARFLRATTAGSAIATAFRFFGGRLGR
jgi:hypothetical protein